MCRANALLACQPPLLQIRTVRAPACSGLAAHHQACGRPAQLWTPGRLLPADASCMPHAMGCLRLAVGTSELRKVLRPRPARKAEDTRNNMLLGRFVGPSLWWPCCWCQLRTRGPTAHLMTKHIIPQIPHTYRVAIQRAEPNVCDGTSECPHGGGWSGVTPSPGFFAVRDVLQRRYVCIIRYRRDGA